MPHIKTFATIPLLLVLLALQVGLVAQGFQPLRITINKDGLHVLRFEDLSPHTEPLQMVIGRIGLFRGGIEVPIRIEGGASGRFEPGTRIIFFGERETTPRLREGTYILKYSNAPRRAAVRDPMAPGDKDRDEAWRQVTVAEDRLLVHRPTVSKEILDQPHARPWAMKILKPAPDGDHKAVYQVQFDPPPLRGAPGRLEVEIEGPVVEGVRQRISANFNGTELPAIEWATGLRKVLSWPIPHGLVVTRNVVEIRNESPQARFSEEDNETAQNEPNVLFLKRISVEAPTLLLDPIRSTDQVLYELLPQTGETLPWRFRWLAGSEHYLYDVATHSYHRAGRLPPASSGTQRIAFSAHDGLYAPASITPLSRNAPHHDTSGADYIVVTASRFARAIEPLLELRQREGLTTKLVHARDLYDAFGDGRTTPAAIQTFLRVASASWKVKPKYVLLVGDADHDVDGLSIHETLPTFLVPTAYNGLTATDFPFGDLDGDGFPEVAVGRLPFRTEDQVHAYVSRVRASASHPQSGLHRRDLSFVAGEGRFGAIIDQLIETTFRKTIAAEVPPAFRPTMTYSSPKSAFFWPAEQFSSRVATEISKGSLAFTYVGHGSPRAFDQVRVNGRRHPILGMEALKEIDCGNRVSFVAIIACWTGEFDRPDRDCIGEELLRHAAGPQGVLAASRISHPYPGALFGKGLARATFATPTRRVGDIITEARRIMMSEAKGTLGLLARPFLSSAVRADDLVRDHLALFNLLGCPALTLPIPDTDIVVKPSGEARAGSPLSVIVEVGQRKGTVVLSLDRSLDQRANALTPATSSDPEAIKQHHDDANRSAVVELREDVKEGASTFSLPIPGDLPAGTYILRAYLLDAEGRDAAQSIMLPVIGN